MSEKLYKVSEVAKRLQIHPQTLYRAIAEGRLEHYRIGKTIRLPMPKPEAVKGK